METKIIYKRSTDQESYENLQQMHKEDPNLFMDPEKWKKLQLANLKEQGLAWTS